MHCRRRHRWPARWRHDRRDIAGMGADAIDLGKTIYPHPTFGETIGMAGEVYEGVCMDVLPSGKKAPKRVSH